MPNDFFKVTWTRQRLVHAQVLVLDPLDAAVVEDDAGLAGLRLEHQAHRLEGRPLHNHRHALRAFHDVVAGLVVDQVRLEVAEARGVDDVEIAHPPGAVGEDPKALGDLPAAFHHSILAGRRRSGYGRRPASDVLK